MKNFILLLIVFLFLSIGEITAQKFTSRPFIATQTEVIAHNNVSKPKPYLQENWSNESLKAIVALSKKHGKPYQISNRNLIWFVNGTCSQTINFSESFSLELQDNNFNEVNFRKTTTYISLLPIETGICTNVIIKKSI